MSEDTCGVSIGSSSSLVKSNNFVWEEERERTSADDAFYEGISADDSACAKPDKSLGDSAGDLEHDFLVGLVGCAASTLLM